VGTITLSVFFRFCDFWEGVLWNVEDIRGRFQELKKTLIGYAVVNIFSVAPGLQDAGVPHHPQVLRDEGLSFVKHCF